MSTDEYPVLEGILTSKLWLKVRYRRSQFNSRLLRVNRIAHTCLELQRTRTNQRDEVRIAKQRRTLTGWRVADGARKRRAIRFGGSDESLGRCIIRLEDRRE